MIDSTHISSHGGSGEVSVTPSSDFHHSTSVGARAGESRPPDERCAGAVGVDMDSRVTVQHETNESIMATSTTCAVGAVGAVGAPTAGSGGREAADKRAEDGSSASMAIDLGGGDGDDEGGGQEKPPSSSSAEVTESPRGGGDNGVDNASTSQINIVSVTAPSIEPTAAVQSPNGAAPEAATKKRRISKSGVSSPGTARASSSQLQHHVRDASKRRTVRTTRFDVDEYCNNEEQAELQNALRISKTETKRVNYEPEVPFAPTFYPTVEEFSDTIGYILKIREKASRYGICKIVPPKEWQYPCQIDLRGLQESGVKVEGMVGVEGSAGGAGGSASGSSGATATAAGGGAADSTTSEHGEHGVGAAEAEQAQQPSVAPAAPAAPAAPLADKDKDKDKDKYFTFGTSLQRLDTLQEGEGYDDGQTYTLPTYKAMADRFKLDWIRRRLTEKHAEKSSSRSSGAGEGAASGAGAEESSLNLPSTYAEACQAYPIEELIKDYWDVVETGCTKVEVEYGNDLDVIKYSSGFLRPHKAYANNPIAPGSVNSTTTASATDNSAESSAPAPAMFTEDWYRSTGWSLINLPNLPGSLLRHISTPINGVNVPWLYIGMLFTTFCWHNEDNYLASINYNHHGETKVWYGVPGGDASKFEKVAKTHLSASFKETPDLLHKMSTQISPSLLYANNVPVVKLYQDAGSFVITFPQAYHGGFSTGFNIGEAVNFATMDWLLFGRDADERYRSFKRPSVFSHTRLLFVLANKGLDVDVGPSKFYRAVLARELKRIVEEDLAARPYLLSVGVQDISKMVTLPPNDFSSIDNTSANYDEMRVCHVCEHYCIFTAVGCQCNQSRVSCTRHHRQLCKCPDQKKFLFTWATDAALQSIVNDTAKLIEQGADDTSSKVQS